MPREWMLRFARTVGSQLVDALGARLEAGSQSQVRVAGIALTGEPGTLPEAEEEDRFGLPAWARKRGLEDETRIITGDDLRLGTSFHLSSASEDHTARSGVHRLGPQRHRGFDAEVDGVRLDGDVTTTVIGADAGFGATLAGVMLSQSTGEGSYQAIDAQTESGAGTVRSDVSGVYPYGQAELGSGLSVWAMAGVGRGTIEVVPEDRDDAAPALETDLSMRMGALGLRGRVLDGTGPSGIALDIRSDAMWVATKSARSDEMVGTQGDVGRLRLIVSGERSFASESGATFVPSAEIGLRHDAGDAETGTGVEVGAGLRYAWGRLSIDARARTLVAHEDDGYEEWGASAGVAYAAKPSGSGLSLSLRPQWGRAESATETRWSATHSAQIANDDAFDVGTSVLAELGYGFGLRHNRGVLTTYTGLELGDNASRTGRAGLRWSYGSDTTVRFEATQNASNDGTGETQLRLEAGIRF